MFIHFPSTIGKLIHPPDPIVSKDSTCSTNSSKDNPSWMAVSLVPKSRGDF